MGNFADIEETNGKIVIDEEGHSVFYRIFGVGDESFLHLHGGPGAGSGRALPFAALARAPDIKVILYDQLGCGQSDKPDDPSLWTVRRFVEEVEAVRRRLNLGKLHLMGRSWGGMLALQYALDYPDNLKSLILSNTGADGAECAAALHRLYSELPVEVYRKVLRYIRGEDLSQAELHDMMAEFMGRHMRRTTPFNLEESKAFWLSGPLAGLESFLKLQSFQTLWGSNIAQCTGPIAQWSVADRLHEIKAPTLILCGLYDEIPPEVHKTMAKRIPDNEFIIFGNSSHLITEEKESAAYLGVISNFLSRVT